MPDGGALVQNKESVEKAAGYAERIINGNDGLSGLSEILRSQRTDAKQMKKLVVEAANIIRVMDKGINGHSSGMVAKLIPLAEAPETKNFALEVSSIVPEIDPGLVWLTKSFVWHYLMAGFSKGLQEIDKDYHNECCVISL